MVEQMSKAQRIAEDLFGGRSSVEHSTEAQRHLDRQAAASRQPTPVRITAKARRIANDLYGGLATEAQIVVTQRTLNAQRGR